MGAPTSAVLAEIFIQNLEHTIIYKTVNKHEILDYQQYVDDILITYREHYTNVENILDDFNRIHSKITFTVEEDTQN
jgi:hypothetical protein